MMDGMGENHLYVVSYFSVGKTIDTLLFNCMGSRSIRQASFAPLLATIPLKVALSVLRATLQSAPRPAFHQKIILQLLSRHASMSITRSPLLYLSLEIIQARRHLAGSTPGLNPFPAPTRPLPLRRRESGWVHHHPTLRCVKHGARGPSI